MVILVKTGGKTSRCQIYCKQKKKTVNERIEIRVSLYSDCKGENFLFLYSLEKKSSLIIFPDNHQSTFHGFYLLLWLFPAQWLKMYTITYLVICSKTLDPVTKFCPHSLLENCRCLCALAAALHLCAGTQRVQIRKIQETLWNKTERSQHSVCIPVSSVLPTSSLHSGIYIPLDS